MVIDNQMIWYSIGDKSMGVRIHSRPRVEMGNLISIHTVPQAILREKESLLRDMISITQSIMDIMTIF